MSGRGVAFYCQSASGRRESRAALPGEVPRSDLRRILQQPAGFCSPGGPPNRAPRPPLLSGRPFRVLEKVETPGPKVQCRPRPVAETPILTLLLDCRGALQIGSAKNHNINKCLTVKAAQPGGFVVAASRVPPEVVSRSAGTGLAADVRSGPSGTFPAGHVRFQSPGE